MLELNPDSWDLAIIGLGPAGLKAAQLAASYGKSVIAFEKNKVGGTCLNVGCIPTKAIIHAASTGKSWEEMMTFKNSTVEKLNKAVEKDLINRGIKIVYETASVKDGAVFANGEKYVAKNIIIATGSFSRELEGLLYDEDFVLNSDDILKLEKLPKNIAIIGSGAIGIEWARIFNTLGVDVTVVEAAQALLPSADKDVQKRIERIFKMKKIKFYINTTAKRENRTLVLSNNETLTPDIVLVAAGREKVVLDGGIIIIGDANGESMLAHSATHQAIAAIEKIFKSGNSTFNSVQVPSVIYGEPEIASIGVREQDLSDTENYKIYNLPIAYLPKAWCDEQIEGFIKIITKDGQILGAHIISKEASALITQIAIAMHAKMSTDELRKVIFPHPTFSEGIFEALENG